MLVLDVGVYGQVVERPQQVFDIGGLVRELYDWAVVDGGLTRWLGQPLHVAKELGMLGKDSPVDAKLRGLGLKNDTSVFVPDV
jgi:hypothetical protein